VLIIQNIIMTRLKQNASQKKENRVLAICVTKTIYVTKEMVILVLSCVGLHDVLDHTKLHLMSKP